MRHLCKGCRSFTEIADLIGESVPAIPSPRLRESLLRRISNSPQIPGILYSQSGLLLARSGEFAWQDLAPGIFLKTLYQDDTRKHHTSLVRMEAGARYPSHSHAAIEELFMLSGDLHVENQVIRGRRLLPG
jgi:ChrR Cupin-like domain